MKVDDLERELLQSFTIRPAWSSTELAFELGVSRQAVHRRLRDLVERGVLRSEGRARATRYRLADRVHIERQYSPQGLQEDEVWKELREALATAVDLSPAAEGRYSYAFTEMLNNAIEHAEAESIGVRFESQGADLWFSVEDDGVGIFDKLMTEFSLPTGFDAVAELSKGKFTTDQQAHTGEGIFFTSRAARRFEIDSGGIAWVVDNVVEDMAIEERPYRKGTVVLYGDDPHSETPIEEVFARFTEDFEFNRSHAVVKLASYGKRLVSRSEARRLVNRLEQFAKVLLDFAGVDGVGQGFVDEVFRVFARRHPEVELEPVNMNDAVEFIVRRGQAAAR